MEPTQSSLSKLIHNNNPNSIPLHQSWLTSYTNNPSMFFSSNQASRSFNLNHDEEAEELDVDVRASSADNAADSDHLGLREPMFEKPLTPSDVGKLNRLVIPKQHAEKYFPLGGGDSGDKGLLLSFEDESGKCWRFRYSYWNSSQSYVLTKGWSRYVKEKQLDAGDIILFQRHRTDGDRLFIGWRRRGAAVALAAAAAAAAADAGATAAATVNSGGGGGSRGLYQGQGQGQGHHPYLGHTQGHGGANVPYQPDCLHAGGSMVQAQAPAANPKRLLRLFGVNLECQLDESEPSTPDSSSVSSQGQTHHPFYSDSFTSNYMDITFSRDMKQMRNHQG